MNNKKQIQDSKKKYVEVYERIHEIGDDVAEYIDLEDDLVIEGSFLINNVYTSESMTYKQLYQRIKGEQAEGGK